MQWRSGLALLFAAIFIAALPAQQRTAAEEEVLQAQHKRFEAVIARDIKALEPTVADDLTYCRGSGDFTDTKAAYLERVRSGTRWLKFAPEGVSVHVYGDVAVITERVRETVIPEPGRSEMTPYVRTIEVYVKRGGQWKFAHYQSTVIQERPSR